MKQKHVWLIVSWFGISGLFNHMRGTWGTLAALPFAFIVQYYLGNIPLALIACVLFIAGIITSNMYVSHTGKQDPGEIVIDEVAATCALLAFMPLSWQSYIAAFILFRLFDILKPWPVSWADRTLKGGFGVMVDDMMAGLYPVAIMLVLFALKPEWAEMILSWLEPV